MNIIVIVSDTLRRDYLGCYGNDWVKTPNLDALASQAIRFDNAWVGSFPTIPMRADLFTGRYAFHRQGWAALPKGDLPLQALLKEQGYVTMLIADHTQMLGPGMNFHQEFDGFDFIRGQAGDRYVTDHIEVQLPCAPEKLRMPDIVRRHMVNRAHWRQESDWYVAQTMRRAADWLERNHSHEKFYLYVDTFDPHEPWDPPQWYVDIYDPGYQGDVVVYPRYDRAGYLTEAELNHVRALYAGEVSLVDKWVGMLLDKVKQLGLWEKTAIIFISDHGWYHGEHGYIGKHTVLEPKKGWPYYREVATIPLIIWIPGMEGGRESDVLLQPTDVMPTILELGGGSLPEGYQIHGRSVLPVLRGEVEEIRELAVTSWQLSEDPETLAYNTITDGEWTLIHGGANAPVELYHLPDDPHEENNVTANYPEVVERLHQGYVELLEGIGTSEDRLRLRRTYKPLLAER